MYIASQGPGPRASSCVCALARTTPHSGHRRHCRPPRPQTRATRCRWSLRRSLAPCQCHVVTTVTGATQYFVTGRRGTGWDRDSPHTLQSDGQGGWQMALIRPHTAHACTVHACTAWTLLLRARTAWGVAEPPSFPEAPTALPHFSRE